MARGVDGFGGVDEAGEHGRVFEAAVEMGGAVGAGAQHEMAKGRRDAGAFAGAAVGDAPAGSQGGLDQADAAGLEEAAELVPAALEHGGAGDADLVGGDQLGAGCGGHEAEAVEVPYGLGAAVEQAGLGADDDGAGVWQVERGCHVHGAAAAEVDGVGDEGVGAEVAALDGEDAKAGTGGVGVGAADADEACVERGGESAGDFDGDGFAGAGGEAVGVAGEGDHRWRLRCSIPAPHGRGCGATRRGGGGRPAFRPRRRASCGGRARAACGAGGRCSWR